MFRILLLKIYGLLIKFFLVFNIKFEYQGALRYVWIKKLGIKTILDVGANKGQSILQWTSILGDNLIFHSFEPLSHPFSVLKKHYGNKKNIYLHNYGLANKISNEKMYVSNRDDSSSVLAPTEIMKDTYKNIHFDKEDIIHLKKLDTIFPDLKVHENILLKIDTQGYELEVLKGSISVLPQITIIIVELSFAHFYDGQPLFGDVYDFLKEYDFVYYGTFDQSTDPKDGKILQQDAIFINKNNFSGDILVS